MRTDYPLHDKSYKHKKTTGHSGWDTQEGAAETLKVIEEQYSCAKMPESGTLLEIGCGAGENSVWFAKQGYTVSGMDIAPTAIEWAEERATAEDLVIDFRTGNVLTLEGYAEGSFDIVHDGHCLHCIIGEQDRTAVLSSVKRVLKPGGVLYVGTMSGEWVPILGGEFDQATRCLVVKDIATRYIGLPEDIRREIINAGFVIEYESFIPYEKDETGVFGELIIKAIKE